MTTCFLLIIVGTFPIIVLNSFITDCVRITTQALRLVNDSTGHCRGQFIVSGKGLYGAMEQSVIWCVGFMMRAYGVIHGA